MAKDLKKREIVLVAGKRCKIIEIEISDIAKHGKSKVRLEILTPEEEKLVIIRPADFPMEVSNSV